LPDILVCDAGNNRISWIRQVSSGVYTEYPIADILAPAHVEAIDIDGDGLKDIVTGKRFWAHGATGDPEPNAPAVLYWFKLVRSSAREAEFIPQLIDDDSGVGTQVTAGFVSNKKYPDIVVGNKKGVFVFEHTLAKAKVQSSTSRESSTSKSP